MKETQSADDGHTPATFDSFVDRMESMDKAATAKFDLEEDKNY